MRTHDAVNNHQKPSRSGRSGGKSPADRSRMVNRQLAGRGIHDQRVLEAMRSVPREKFLPPSQRRWAYADRALLLSHGQTVSQPYVVAATLQALELTPNCRVLEVGAGSGYAAAVAGLLAKEVVALERIGDLAESARRRLADLGYVNVSVVWADGISGYPERSPYDAVFVSAAAASVPPALFEQLTEGGRLVAPVGSSRGHQDLAVYRKQKEQTAQRSKQTAAGGESGGAGGKETGGKETGSGDAGSESGETGGKETGNETEGSGRTAGVAPPRRNDVLFPVTFVPLLPGLERPGKPLSGAG